MLNKTMNRRDFSRMTAAAFGGLVAGTHLSGCSNSGATTGSTGTTSAADMHACKGLNGCEGEGAGGNNACAGQGGCAAPAAHHECKGHNACKGQGGGENAGINACKGQGGCAVPIKDEDTWKKARTAFEQRMQAARKPVGNPPA